MKDLHALWRQSLAGLRLLVVATVVVGLAYPLLVLGIGRVVAPWRADGSLVTADGTHTTDASQAVGSALLGQLVDGAAARELFLPRPSAAGDGYDPEASYGSNLGPNDATLLADIAQRQAAIARREGVDVAAVPPDAVTASGSGLDPDISPAYAALQVPRVARATGLDETTVRRLVAEHTDGRTLGFLGEPRVNVLLLNVAVLQAAGRPAPTSGPSGG